MDQKDIQAWQQEKAKELFAYSHKLLDAAKDLSEHHIAEIQWGMKNAMESAKSAAKNDLAKLKELQESASKEAAEKQQSSTASCHQPTCGKAPHPSTQSIGRPHSVSIAFSRAYASVI